MKDWFDNVSALQPVTPPTKELPLTADLAVLVPRCETAPVALARYLLSDVPFALLIPVDLLAMGSAPNLYRQSPHKLIEERFAKAGKVTILATQMSWVIGNLQDCHPVEMFSTTLRTPAPVTGFNQDPAAPSVVDDADLDEIEGTLPRTLEAWVRAQQRDDGFAALLASMVDTALLNGLWIKASAGTTPTIIVPSACQELLIRDTHIRMFHLGHAKVFATLRRSYVWPDMKKQTRNVLADCPECELNKARQNTAHALFHATPIYAPVPDGVWIFKDRGLHSPEKRRPLLSLTQRRDTWLSFL